MLGEYGTLSAKSTYSYTNTDGWVYHDRFSKYHVTLVIDIILAENSLRSTVQREDALINKIRAAKKLTGVDDNDVELGPLEEELKELKKTRCHRVRDLYEEECQLRMGSLRRGYMSVKSNPAWYLREELVEDCIGRGGCCSRDCGCCARRRLSAKDGRGIGHCTVECMCCIHDRGSEFTEKEKRTCDTRLAQTLRSHNPAFVLRIANAYFSKPLVWKLDTKNK
ncbi:hypothetical protein N7453_002206 [Penicillium expansum]|nr:hypothetical protein N7453_002206 [Penicillium expansum]